MTEIEQQFIAIVRDLDEARRRLNRQGGYAKPPLSDRAREGVRRVFGEELTAEEVADRILGEVQREGDAALRRYTQAFDGTVPDPIEVPTEMWEEAYAALPPELADALEVAAEQIEAFHQKQLRNSWLDWTDEGALGQIIRPLERIGIYVPGGLAAYP
jgi:histidinol dehydrogenase